MASRAVRVASWQTHTQAAQPTTCTTTLCVLLPPPAALARPPTAATGAQLAHRRVRTPPPRRTAATYRARGQHRTARPASPRQQLNPDYCHCKHNPPWPPPIAGASPQPPQPPQLPAQAQDILPTSYASTHTRHPRIPTPLALEASNAESQRKSVPFLIELLALTLASLLRSCLHRSLLLGFLFRVSLPRSPGHFRPPCSSLCLAPTWCRRRPAISAQRN